MRKSDALIIGQGPAGVSAALYLQRAGFHTVLAGNGPGGLARAEMIENYYGLPAPVSGLELYENGRAQALRLEAELCDDEITGIAFGEDGYELAGKKDTYAAKAVLFATGAARVAPKIPGLAQHEGSGVSYCAVCDGFFFRGKPVAVLGAGDYALHEAGELLPLSSAVTLLTDGAPLPENLPEGLLTDTRKIAALEGEPVLAGVRFEEGEPLAVNGLFVAVGVASAADLARKLGAETDGKYIKVNGEMATNCPGVFAAGDCVGGLLQVSKSVADGAIAGMGMIKYLRGLKK